MQGNMTLDGFASLLGRSHKSDLSDRYSMEYETRMMYLTPYITNVDGIDRNLCPNAAKNLCHLPCLNTSGHGAQTKVQEIRKARTLLFWRNRPRFMSILRHGIAKHSRRARKNGRTAAVRLNGVSDIAWETMGVMEEFPNVVFYDYTKSVKRMKRYLLGLLPANYSLTFSRGAGNDEECAEVLGLGGNVAMVWESQEAIPDAYMGYRVINGVEHDLRFLDIKGVIVGLKAIGKAKKDMSGFVIREEGAC
jgi:hypothetical protein